MLGYALARLEPERAKDAALDVVVAWRRLGDVPPEPAGWLFGVARKVVAQQLRAESRRDALAERLAAPGYRESGRPADPADLLAQRDAALAALARLGERDREVLTLLAWHGLATGQAAEALGLTSLQLRRPAAPGPSPPGERACRRRCRARPDERSRIPVCAARPGDRRPGATSIIQASRKAR